MRSRHPPSPAAVAQLDDDDLLSEIFFRLPPEPSSLPRASAVCKRWRSLASDPGFFRRFRRRHRRDLPLLGCFVRGGNALRFLPTLDPPNRIPQGRFHFPIDARDRNFKLLGCRHGFLLMLRTSQAGTLELLVWDPLNGHEHPLAIPPGFCEKTLMSGAVLRAALDHFQVVLVGTDLDQRVIARVYSSENGLWGNLISTPHPPDVSEISPAVIDPLTPAVLVGDSLYMLFLGKSSSIIGFDVDKQSLAVIPLPVGLDPKFSPYFSVIRAEGGGLGLLFVSLADNNVRLWKRKTDCDGVDLWVLHRTVEPDSLLSLDLQSYWGIRIQGFAEENNVVFLSVDGNVFMVQLDSLQVKQLPEMYSHQSYPFEGVYAAGI